MDLLVTVMETRIVRNFPIFVFVVIDDHWGHEYGRFFDSIGFGVVSELIKH